MTKRDKKTVLGVFKTLLNIPYGELNTVLGSLTLEEMYDICHKIKKELNIDGEDEQ